MVERSRSRSFIELLANQPIRPPRHIPEALLRQEQTLRHELQRLYASPTHPPEQVTALESALDEVMRQIRLIDSEYVDLRIVRPLTHRQVQKRLAPGTALLSYFMTDSEILAFVVTPDALTAHLLPLRAKDLQRAFDENGYLLRMNLGADGRLREPWILQPLYDGLIRPLAERLQGLNTLCILPHGPLHLVPFQALTGAASKEAPGALLDAYRIVYAPSATVLLKFCQQKRGSAAHSVLAVGYNDHNLRHPEAEVQAIAGLVDGGVALVNTAATNQALFAQGERFRWVHLACHGRFNRQAPLMSYLRLAGGPLYAADVLQQLRLQAELVTLGACETGRNQVLKGDELLGLVRAFIYAGASSVLVSLWPVDELSTRILMERFYRQLLAGVPKAEALRSAQQDLRRLTAPQVAEILAGYGEPDPHEQVQQLLRLTATAMKHPQAHSETCIFSHPYFWAPFVLIGDRL
jgi:CHAT domain-containing protein